MIVKINGKKYVRDIHTLQLIEINTDNKKENKNVKREGNNRK